MDGTAIAIVGVAGSIIAALAGAAVGGRIAGRTARDIERERRLHEDRERRIAVIAAARLLFRELAAAQTQVQTAITNDTSVPLKALPTAVWDAHGPLLAGELDSDTLTVITDVTSRLGIVARMAQALSPTDRLSTATGLLDRLRELEQKIASALETVDKIEAMIGPPRRPASGPPVR